MLTLAHPSIRHYTAYDTASDMASDTASATLEVGVVHRLHPHYGAIFRFVPC